MPSFVYTQEDLVVAGILPIDEMRDYIAPIRIVSFVSTPNLL